MQLTFILGVVLLSSSNHALPAALSAGLFPTTATAVCDANMFGNRWQLFAVGGSSDSKFVAQHACSISVVLSENPKSKTCNGKMDAINMYIVHP
jgi:hypothetical protein